MDAAIGVPVDKQHLPCQALAIGDRGTAHGKEVCVIPAHDTNVSGALHGTHLVLSFARCNHIVEAATTTDDDGLLGRAKC